MVLWPLAWLRCSAGFSQAAQKRTWLWLLHLWHIQTHRLTLQVLGVVSAQGLGSERWAHIAHHTGEGPALSRVPWLCINNSSAHCNSQNKAKLEKLATREGKDGEGTKEMNKSLSCPCLPGKEEADFQGREKQWINVNFNTEAVCVYCWWPQDINLASTIYNTMQPPVFFPLSSLNLCVCVKCCWKIVTFNKGLYPATIFPDTQWPFKPDWGEGVWSLDFEPARPRCAPLLAWPLFIVSLGSVLYAKQAGLAAWTFANQFVCEGESTGVKDGLGGHTAPSLCDIIACGTLVSHVCPKLCWKEGGCQGWGWGCGRG